MKNAAVLERYESSDTDIRSRCVEASIWVWSLPERAASANTACYMI